MRTTSILTLLSLVACQDAGLSVYDSPPAITVLRPVTGTSFEPGQPFEFCASVSDENLDDVDLLLESSLDGILADEPREFTACDGGNLGFELVLTEGEHQLSITATDDHGQTTTETITISATPNQPPSCTILAPQDGDAFVEGDIVPFSATVSDPEAASGMLPVSIASNLDGQVWNGKSDSDGGVTVNLAELSAGTHDLALEVQDFRGAVDTCHAVVIVSPCRDLDEDGFTTCDDDCDDTDDTVYPGAEEIADGEDNDCNGETDESTSLSDDDQDGWTEIEGDCNDNDASVAPDLSEVWYNGIDNDCSGGSDFDRDLDGQDLAANGGLDCDDLNAAIFAGANETWYDGVDQNCDGKSDFDQDGDGSVVDDDCNDLQSGIHPGASEAYYDGIDQDCNGKSDFDQDGDGSDALAFGGQDCNDLNAAIFVGATETWYDGFDQNCDGKSDFDRDGDGFASANHGGSDCDDSKPGIHPGASEVWYDGIDQDCSGGSDYDRDGDGQQSSDWFGVDCNDQNAAIFSGATEVWYDGIDQNCDGKSDFDQDGDLADAEDYGGDDCDDGLAAVHVGATEVWYDGIDQDCDGKSDFDRDGDGYTSDNHGGADCEDTKSGIHPNATEIWYDGVDQNCSGGSDYDRDGDGQDSAIWSGTDCNDLNLNIFEGATEIWYDGVDQNCDGTSDFDQDGDLAESDEHGGDDCDDLDPDVSPDAEELRDGFDNNCDNLCDEGLLFAGDLQVTEILFNPKAITGDTPGEWFEVYNPTDTDIALCGGWTIGDNSLTVPVTTDVLIPSGEYAVFGQSTSGNNGVPLDFAYGTTIALSNTADKITLKFDDGASTLLIDEVSYTQSSPWLDVDGQSLALKRSGTGAYYSYLDNDSGDKWCISSTPFGAMYGTNSYDMGTPGAANDCP